MNYVAYNSDGRITQSGACPDDALAFQGAPGTTKLEVDDPVDPNLYYVSSGVLTLLPTKPSAHHEFNYTTQQWVANNDRAWVAIRFQRDQLLAGTDWRVTKAMEAGATLPQAWVDYRQALRDVTTQSDPTNITWPVAPA